MYAKGTVKYHNGLKGERIHLSNQKERSQSRSKGVHSPMASPIQVLGDLVLPPIDSSFCAMPPPPLVSLAQAHSMLARVMPRLYETCTGF